MTPECERLGLIARRIEQSLDVELLRQIRNECKDGFSQDNEYITPDQQTAWWTKMQGRVKAWLYWHRTDVVGYGLLRQTEDGRWWTSVAVLPEFAGRGYGGAITADVIRRHPVVTWAVARLDNPAAVRMHRLTDWERWDDERLANFKTLPHVYMGAAMSEWQSSGWCVA